MQDRNAYNVFSVVAGFSAPLMGILYERTGFYDRALLGMIFGYVLYALLYLTIGRYRYTTDFRIMTAPGKAVPPVPAEAGFSSGTESR